MEGSEIGEGGRGCNLGLGFTECSNGDDESILSDSDGGALYLIMWRRAGSDTALPFVAIGEVAVVPSMWEFTIMSVD